MNQHKIINCADAYPIALTLFEATNPKGIVIIAGAIGVPQMFYSRFAEFLKQHNYHCISFSYRGTEQSLANNKPFDVKLDDWGAQDIEAVIQFAKNIAVADSMPLPMHFIGHSVGGQLLGLAPSAVELKSLVFVASSSPYWRRWRFPDNIKMLLAPKLVFPIVAMGRDEFPTRRLGLGTIKIPTKVAMQWAAWMLKPDYLFDKQFGFDLSNYHNITQPLLSLGFSDDSLAPEINIKKLLDQYSQADIHQKIIDPQSVDVSAIGHTGFFKDKFRDNLWQDLVDWLG